MEKGWNKDRHACKTCTYRTSPEMRRTGNCNFILLEGHSRGCAVEDCDKYQKGKLRRVKEGGWK